MRRIIVPLLAAVVALAFASCGNLAAPSMGHLSISVPPITTGTASRALGSPARSLVFGPTDAPAIRIYVVLNGTFIPSENADYFQNNLSTSTGDGANTFSIDLVPSRGYQVYAAIGSTAGGWQTKYYGSTDLFSVSSGVYTNASLAVVASALSTTPSATPAFAATVNGSLWEVVGGNVIPPAASPIPLSNLTVNSLTAGQWPSSAGFAPELWLNTDSGIYAVSGSGISTRVPQTYASGVTSSTVFGASIDGTSNDLAIAYFGSDLGIAYSASTTSTAVDSTWTTASLTDYLNTSAGSSFKNYVTDPGKFVSATAIVFNGGSSYGYIATSLGSYYYNSSVQSQVGTDPIGWIKSQLTSTNSAYALIAASGGKSEAITSLALDLPLDGSATSPKTLYAGTEVGLFWTTLNAGVPAANSLSPMAGSATPIKKLAAASFGGASYAAYIGGDGSLTILKDGSAVSSNYPFYAFTSSASGVTSLAFYANGGALNLALGCQDGLTTVSVVSVP